MGSEKRGITIPVALTARIAVDFPQGASVVSFESNLPVSEVLPALQAALASHSAAVLEAPPGAGKTTLVPLALLHSAWLGSQKIIMLEPRRLAARAAAERLAQLLGEPVGHTVGYRIRLESRIGPATRIEVVTEGILLRQLQQDPDLPGVGLVIFDEFHERSLDADLGLALCLQTQQYLRDDPPLRLLVMSATLEAGPISALLGDAPVVRSEGRQYPVDIRYGAPAQANARIDDQVTQAVHRALDEEPGNILVFLPGTAEIRRVQAALETSLAAHAKVVIAPLYGELDLAAQRLAIAPPPAGQRKVVLATSIAETSLTIEGIRVVVDAGLSREPAFDPASGMTRLQTRRVSRSAADQRAGRAGRLEPGICYRLWSAGQHEQLASQAAPEILQADLAPLALQLARWGVQQADELAWIDPPPAAALQQGRELLEKLGALVREGDHWRLTSHGQAMSVLPVHPRLAHMLLRAKALGLSETGCRLAAVLAERDLLRGSESADITRRLAVFEDPRGEAGVDRAALTRARQLARQWATMLEGRATDKPVSNPEHADWAGVLLALAYPDRLAQRRGERGSDYRLANGKAAGFTRPDSLQQSAWLVVGSLGGHTAQRSASIFLAAAVDLAQLERYAPELFRYIDTLEWDARSESLVAERQKCVGALVCSRETLAAIDPERRALALCEVVRRQGLSLLPWTPALRQWQARIVLLRTLDLQNGHDSFWPDVSDQALLANLENWLAPWLDRVTRLAHFASLDLAGILAGLLSWPLPSRLDEEAPTHWTVPTGSRIRIDYSETPPVLAVRLQEMFGSTETPRIAGGRVALKLHLLSPAQRPLQVTQDLAGFWSGSYAEVKKDMKGRYPKHYWPDDPLHAEPTARAKPRR